MAISWCSLCIESYRKMHFLFFIIFRVTIPFYGIFYELHVFIDYHLWLGIYIYIYIKIYIDKKNLWRIPLCLYIQKDTIEISSTGGRERRIQELKPKELIRLINQIRKTEDFLETTMKVNGKKTIYIYIYIRRTGSPITKLLRARITVWTIPIQPQMFETNISIWPCNIPDKTLYCLWRHLRPLFMQVIAVTNRQAS